MGRFFFGYLFGLSTAISVSMFIPDNDVSVMLKDSREVANSVIRKLAGQ